MNKTKEEILKRKMPINQDGSTYSDENWNVLVRYDHSFEAMDEWADIKTKDCIQFLLDNERMYMDAGSVDEIYNSYLQSKSK